MPLKNNRHIYSPRHSHRVGPLTQSVAFAAPGDLWRKHSNSKALAQLEPIAIATSGIVWTVQSLSSHFHLPISIFCSNCRKKKLGQQQQQQQHFLPSILQSYWMSTIQSCRPSLSRRFHTCVFLTFRMGCWCDSVAPPSTTWSSWRCCISTTTVSAGWTNEPSCQPKAWRASH